MTGKVITDEILEKLMPFLPHSKGRNGKITAFFRVVGLDSYLLSMSYKIHSRRYGITDFMPSSWVFWLTTSWHAVFFALAYLLLYK